MCPPSTLLAIIGAMAVVPEVLFATLQELAEKLIQLPTEIEQLEAQRPALGLALSDATEKLRTQFHAPSTLSALQAALDTHSRALAALTGVDARIDLAKRDLNIAEREHSELCERIRQKTW